MPSKRDGISPRDFAAAIGVSESSIKRWVDQGLLHAVRTAGGHRRITPEEAMRWLRQHHMMPVHPERLGWSRDEIASLGSLDSQVDAFFQLLSAGKAEEARAFVMRAHLAGQDAAHLADELVAPTMSRIGMLWHASDEGVLIEHRATEIVLHIVKELYGVIMEHGQRVRTVNAVGAAVEGDSHMLAAAWTGVTLAELGMAVTNLGSGIPAHLIETGARMVDAKFVYLTASVAMEPAVGAKTREVIAGLLARGVFVAAGGLHVGELALQPHDRLLISRSQVELQAFAKRAL